MNDLELLRQYSQDGSQAAFTAVVVRHVDLVHSIARRHVQSSGLAEEITQTVFLDLARNAGKLRADSRVASWLHTVARRTSIDVVRREIRRRSREQAAVEGAEIMNTPASDWTRVEPLLDEAISSLGEADRQAVLLRFFERKNFKDIGDALGASEEAARKRVDRGLDRLRGFLASRGVTASAAGLAAGIASNAVHAAPPALAENVASFAAFSGHAALQTAILHSTQTVTMTFLQKTAFVAVIAAALTGGFFQHRVIESQDQRIAALEKANQEVQRQLRQAKAEHSADLGRPTAPEGNRPTQTSVVASDPADVAMQSWLGRVKLLRDRLEQTPTQKTPELQLLTDEDWLDAAKKELLSDVDYRRALASLRTLADQKAIGKMRPALTKYTQANNGQFPASPSDLLPYFDEPMSDEILQRFEVVSAKEVPNMKLGGDWIITQRAPVDESFDARVILGLKGSGSMGDFTPFAEARAFQEVLDAYRAGGGPQPVSLSALESYATTPDQQTALQKMLQRRSEHQGESGR